MYRRGGEPEFLKMQGSLAIGSFEDSPYVRETLTLGVGDSLVVYSDGVTEAMNRDEALFPKKDFCRHCGKSAGITLMR